MSNSMTQSLPKEQKKRYYPCPYCKGRGGWKEVVIEETGEGPWDECNYCEGKGLIEIGGKIQKTRKLEKMSWDLYELFAKPDKDYSYSHSQKIIRELRKLERLF